MQACWAILLDDDFLDAYMHGMVLECPDGITRRLYPRIFTYSADYPEKYVNHPNWYLTLYLLIEKPQSFIMWYS